MRWSGTACPGARLQGRRWVEPLEDLFSLDTPFGRAEFHVDSSAVIVVDMQNDCVSPHGLFDHGGIDVSPIQAVVTPIADVLAVARRAGLKIVYLRMGY